MWFLLISLHLITNYHRVSFNVIAGILVAEFNLSAAGLGNLAAAYTYMYVLMQLPGGALVDTLGPRRIALLTGLFMAAGSLMIGFAPQAGMVFFGRMLIGLGGSVILINIFKLQAGWFLPSEFATLSGLALFLSGFGLLLGATPLAFMVSLIGWRGSFIAVGLATAAAAFACYRYIRNSPELNEVPEPAFQEHPALRTSVTAPSAETISRILRNRRIWKIFIINLGVFGGFIAFSGTWGVSYLVHVYDFSVKQASGFMVSAYLGYMISAPLAGILSDRLGSRKYLLIAQISCGGLFWLTLAVWSSGVLPSWLLYLLCFLLGLGAASTVLSFPMAKEADLTGYTGIATAVANMGVFLGLAILQPLFGYVLDLGWQGLIVEGARIYPPQAYRLGFIVSFSFAAVALLTALSYREKV